MKTLLLSAILVIATLLSSGQTYKTFDTSHSKGYIIKGKNGKYSSIQSNSHNRNIQSEINFSNSGFQKEEETQPSDTYLKNTTEHHLTLHFDENMNMGDVMITSDSVVKYTWDIIWSNNGYTGEIDLPEASYEIMTMYDDWVSIGPFFVFIHNLNVIGDIDTTISFETMANHKISLQCKDENGNLLSYNDSTLLQKYTMIDIEFPPTCLLGSVSFETVVYNGYIMISDIDQNAGYEILLNQFNVRQGKMYITDMAQLEGITGDTILTNNYSGYKKMNMVMHTSPTSTNNYLTFGYGIHFGGSSIGDNWSIIFGDGVGYSSFDKDTLHVFMENNLMEINLKNTTIAFIPDVNFLEKLPTPGLPREQLVSVPFFINTNDSIAFTSFNVSAASPQFPDNSIVDIGNTAPYIKIDGTNNLMAANTIFSWNTSYGQTNEERQMDNHYSIYEIRKGNDLLVRDTLYLFMDPLVVTESGVYTFMVTNNNYSLGGQKGSSSIISTFDLSKTDANSPVISSCKLLNADNLIQNTFIFNEPGKLLFSTFDFDWETFQMNRPASVQAFFKKYNEIDWTALPLIEQPSLFDSVYYGSFYTCNLAAVFSQFSSSQFLDLKIIATDNDSNSITHSWHPAAYVENTVGISQIVNADNKTLQIYPNPLTQNSIVSFTLSENSNVQLSVYNIDGQSINILLDKKMEKGTHQIRWTETDNSGIKLNQGIYLLKLQTDNAVETTKVVVN